MTTFATTFAPPAVSGNSIIDSLGPDEQRRLQYVSRVVDLEPRQTLYATGDNVMFAYFPAGAVVAEVATTDDGSAVETSLIGSEGVVGVTAAASQTGVLHQTRVLLPGEALRVDAHALRELFEESAAWQSLLLRYYGVLIAQVSRRAVCNALHRLNGRFSTWLLMVRDRARGDDFPLTQGTIARQLGVRRAGVNECVGALQRLGVLDHSRGHIRILQREALEDSACACYAACREELRWTERAASAARAGGAKVV